MTSSSPPLIYMNMGAPTADADEGGVPRWVWLTAAGLCVIALFAAVLYLTSQPPL